MENSSQNINNQQAEIPSKEGNVSKSRKKTSSGIVIASIMILVIAFALGFYYLIQGGGIDLPENGNQAGNVEKKDYSLKKFNSEEEFKDYIEESNSRSGMGYMNNSFNQGRMESIELMAPTMALDMVGKSEAVGMGGGGRAGRVSNTNVQVQGIDEPDIVKTDGKSLFTSIYNYALRRAEPVPFDRTFNTSEDVVIEEPLMELDMVEPEMIIEPGIRPAPSPIRPPEVIDQNATKILEAYPPENLGEISEVEKMGDLLVVNGMLIVFDNEAIYGYDVSNKALPVESWNIPYGESTQYDSGRLYGDKLYLVTKTWVDQSSPCPIVPMRTNGSAFEVSCNQIYHPSYSSPVDTTYTVLKIDTKTGKVDDSVSFVGSSNNSVVYMSPNNIYVTYSYQEDFVNIMVDFVKAQGQDIFPSDVIKKLETLDTYDLSLEAKMVELQSIIDKYLASLSKDDRLRVENDISNRMEEYLANRVREFESTGIAKIDRESLDIKTTGYVPGHPLNQFSLDEYDNNLRIATNSGLVGQWGTDGDVNDVYVLDKDLKELGSVKDLGKDEKIYSTRFIGDKGYVVTFRETDPFYILDLSSPNNPKMTGELKIPGYSSYLHPLNDDLILGVGKENNQVKLSLFDVSDSSNPIEVDKYMLEEYWSDILTTHRAFLADEDNEVFFIPGSNNAYVFSYADDQLELVKAVSEIEAKRAVYLDEYMYVVGADRIVVLDESTWETVTDYK